MKALLAVCGALAAGSAAAHDTWFEHRTDRSHDSPLLALGTGTRFPVFEFPFGMEQLVASGCHVGRRATVALTQVADQPNALVMRPAAPGQPTSCWAQVAPVDAQLAPAIVAIYLDEIRASDAVRADWAAQLQKGLAWRERYTKHARIELSAPPETTALRASPMDMDILLDAPRRPIRPGDTLVFRVQRAQRALPGLAMELHGTDGQPGRWQVTDADGRLRLTTPAAGRWLLRGTELRRDARDPGLWLGGFVTLTFDVAQDDSKVKSNARSTNHSAAIAAISSEPPSITIRR